MRLWTRSDAKTGNFRQLTVIGVVLATCYLYFLPRWADWNQNSRFDQVIALVDDQTLNIDRYVANTGDYAYFSGHYYSDKAPGMAFLGVPAYALFQKLVPDGMISRMRGAAVSNGSLGSTLRENGTGLEEGKVHYFLGLSFTTALTVAFPSVVLGMIFHQVCLVFGCGRGQALVATLLYSLATIAFPYSNSFVGHQTSAFLLFSAFAVLLGVRREALGRGWILLAGFLLGYAAITEYPTVLVAAVIGIYALISRRDWRGTMARLLAGALPPIVLLAIYDMAIFGTPLPTGYSYSSLWTGVHHTGFFSLTYPKPDALLGITVGMHRGLFFLSPYLLLALPGYVAIWRNRSWRMEFWVLLLAPILFILFNSSSAMWQGGFAVGPRYLVPSLPFLALVAGIGLGRCWPVVALRPVVVAICAWSLFAVWAESVGGQSFPDYTANPLFDLSLPRLASGDVARNVGMMFGLSGWMSLIPLGVVVASAAAVLTRARGTPMSRGLSRQIVAPDRGT